MKKLKLAVFLSLLSVLTFYSMSSISAQSANVHGHLLDTQWAGLSDSYTSIEVDITPEVGDGDYYYFANDVYFRNCSGNECVAYAGLQTNGFDGSKWIGKMAIFSLWNATQSIAEPGGTSVAFGGEGVGQSVRIPYNWQVGISYRLKIYLDVDGTSKLWGATLTDLSNNQTTRIGRIYAPVGYGLIYGPVTFHERYGGPDATCQTVTPSQVHFSNMTGNNGTVVSSAWNHYYRASLPGCSNFWVQDSTNGFSSGIGTVPPPPIASTNNPPVASSTPTNVVTAPSPALPKTEPPNPITAPSQTHPTSHTPPSKGLKKASKLFYILIALGSLIIIGSLVAGLSYIGNRKRIKGLLTHFKYDIDIHGPTKS